MLSESQEPWSPCTTPSCLCATASKVLKEPASHHGGVLAAQASWESAGWHWLIREPPAVPLSPTRGRGGDTWTSSFSAHSSNCRCHRGLPSKASAKKTFQASPLSLPLPGRCLLSRGCGLLTCSVGNGGLRAEGCSPGWSRCALPPALAAGAPGLSQEAFSSLRSACGLSERTSPQGTLNRQHLLRAAAPDRPCRLSNTLPPGS